MDEDDSLDLACTLALRLALTTLALAASLSIAGALTLRTSISALCMHSSMDLPLLPPLLPSFFRGVDWRGECYVNPTVSSSLRNCSSSATSWGGAVAAVADPEGSVAPCCRPIILRTIQEYFWRT